MTYLKSINNTLIYLGIITLIIVEIYVCFFIIRFENIEANIALFIGILSVTVSVGLNNYTISKQTEIAKLSIDQTHRIKALAELHGSFNDDDWNRDEIRRLLRVIKFKNDYPDVFYTLFYNITKLFNEINKRYVDDLAYNFSILKYELPDGNLNPDFYANYVWRYLMIALYNETYDEYGSLENTDIPLNTSTLFNPNGFGSDEDEEVMMLLYKENIDDYINGNNEYEEGIPNDPDGSSYTRDKVNEYYNSFLSDITIFNEKFANELYEIWNKYINT